MADILCGYTADRDETLVAYLYGDIEASQRAAFDAHIATCERCRHELEDLQEVRGQLLSWTAPEVSHPLAAAIPLVPGPLPRVGAWNALRDIPAWARLAAAMLLLGVSAGLGGAIANLDVRYDHGGLTLRTGWGRSAPRETTAAAGGAQSRTGGTVAGATAPWQSDLDALERRLRADVPASDVRASDVRASDLRGSDLRGSDLRGSDVRGLASAAGLPATVSRTEGTAAGADAQLLRKVRALLEDSERRQRNELALRIAEVVQEFDTKRGTDLANIRSMRAIQSATGLEQVRQQQWLNLLTQASVQSR